MAVSDAYLLATMTTREGIVGRDLLKSSRTTRTNRRRPARRNLRESLGRVVRHRVSDAMAVQKYDIRRPEADGGGFEERYWSPVNCPCLGPRRQVASILHRVEDVTEFYRLERTKRPIGRGSQPS